MLHAQACQAKEGQVYLVLSSSWKAIPRKNFLQPQPVCSWLRHAGSIHQAPAYKESKLTVVKLGGSVIGYNCENIPLIIKRIKNIREKDCAGPVVVVSAPKGITDEALKIGEKYANGSKVDLSNLWNPYVEAMNNFMKEPYRSEFKTELLSCKEKVGNSLGQVVANKRFVDVNRARILGYSGEILAAIAIDYIINSHELEACH